MFQMKKSFARGYLICMECHSSNAMMTQFSTTKKYVQSLKFQLLRPIMTFQGQILAMKAGVSQFRRADPQSTMHGIALAPL
jgi:hypothetical protein